MRRSTKLAALLLASALAAGPAPAAEQAPAPLVALKRVNLLVRDLDRSLAVYSGILGFRLFAVTESSGKSYSYAVFDLPPEARLRFATLDSSTETRALALTEVRGVELPAARGTPPGAAVVRVERIDEKLAGLRAAGLRVVEPRRSTTPEGQAFTEAAFTDPDGHVVVLYELD